MARLLDYQKEENAIEYTHYDAWEEEYFEDMDREEICEDVIKAWEKSLGLTLHPNKRYANQGLNIYTTLGEVGVLDLVVLAILESGLYDVYSSDTCIEIYPIEENYDDEQ